MSNKHSAKEDEIGKLHSLITKCHNLKAGAVLMRAQQMLEDGEDIEFISAILNPKDLMAMQKWVEYNGVSCSLAEENAESELSKRLKDIKKTQEGKIINFADLKDAM